MALCRERFSKPGKITAGILFAFSAAVWGQQRSPQLASPPPLCRLGASVLVWALSCTTWDPTCSSQPQVLGENCPHAGPCLAKRNSVCWTSSYSIFCFLLIVQCMASSQALLWIQNWCFPYRLFDRLTESSGWAVHKHIYCQASSLSKWKLRNRDIRIASSCPSEQLCEDPQGPGFLGHFTCSKHKSCWCPLWLCTTSISAAQIPGSYLGKNQCEE